MITFKASNVTAEPYEFYQGDTAPGHFITRFADYEKEKCSRVLQSTPESDHSSIVADESGFVMAILRAYNRHHRVLIRPDDVWLAVMVQFGVYVNANAEKLRHLFVSHEGQKELEVTGVGSITTVDWGIMANCFIEAMRKHVKEEEVCDWVLPAFSTTTDHDKIVGSVLLMAVMKKYFSFKACLMCGIPEITLAGTLQDWKEVRQRVDKLLEYGQEDLTPWVIMLRQILDQFVAAFEGRVDLSFWERICHHTSTGSGPSYLSGWISAFCVFDAEGKWQGSNSRLTTWNGSVIQGFDFPVIDISNVPKGYLTVDLKIDDNGEPYDALMFAGHMSYQVLGSDAIAPRLSWAIALR
jgi:hypothetical protein